MTTARMLCMLVGLLASTVVAQVEMHGEVYPLARLTTDDHRFLSLPQRLVAVDVSKFGDKVGLYFAVAVETRMGNDEVALDLREAYVEYQAGFGDVRFGKQIHVWGAVDGNNPTDNVTPYDFYYMFFPDKDRKKSNVSLSSSVYAGDNQVELVFTPIFAPNRMPFGDSDFPIGGDFPEEMLAFEQLPERDLEHAEYGLRVSRPLGSADISVSYFAGNDRMFTPHLSYAMGSTGPYPDSSSYLGYHRTNVLGADLVYYFGDWGFRGEAAYFMTEDTDGTDDLIRNPYFQYVVEIEGSVSDVTLSAQYIGTVITKIDDDVMVFDAQTMGLISEEVNETDVIGAKLGMPFAAIAQNALMAVASVKLLDDQYELGGQLLYDLDNNGYMLGGHLTIALEDAFDLELAISSFGGDKESRLYDMQDFSHISAALKYSF